MQKSLMSVFLILITLLILSCDINIPPDLQSENWIAMIDVDGNNLQYIYKDIGNPYFVPDPDNQDQEIILISGFPNIDLMNMDGSNRRTIIDSVGGVYCLSGDRTKMLLVNDGEIYIANTNGTGLENLTNTPDRWEGEPSFSIGCDKVIYRSENVIDSLSSFICKELLTSNEYCIFEEEYSPYYYYISPIIISDNLVIFGQNYATEYGISGLYSFDIVQNRKALIDSGFINSKIAFNSNNGTIAYRNDHKLKIFYADTGQIDTLEGYYGYGDDPVFNNDGSLLSLNSYIFYTATLESYDVLQYYKDDADNYDYPMNFNDASTKVIMKIIRTLPSNYEEDR